MKVYGHFLYNITHKQKIFGRKTNFLVENVRISVHSTKCPDVCPDFCSLFKMSGYLFTSRIVDPRSGSLKRVFITFSDTADDITTMEQIQGDWWILKGQNCGQDEVWNGGYDAYPCQKVSQEID